MARVFATVAKTLAGDQSGRLGELLQGKGGWAHDVQAFWSRWRRRVASHTFADRYLYQAVRDHSVWERTPVAPHPVPGHDAG